MEKNAPPPNGGVWPFILGFYVAAIVAAGLPHLAQRKLAALTDFVRNARNSSLAFGFNEWVRASDGVACGEDWQSLVRSHVPLCRSVRGTKEGLAVLAIAATKTSISVIRRSNDINGGIREYGAGR